eukprot:TRINITY_DN9953_c0_g1_i1.p1 TRINITY_DN9953_c0_g1~~TRINITY_DN9953_c0_g1_i1.p1  ORF type:complete len:170 (-),score=28.59 TRINITY_DN9953_c0_g1_i1:72-581(-)
MWRSVLTTSAGVRGTSPIQFGVFSRFSAVASTPTFAVPYTMRFYATIPQPFLLEKKNIDYYRARVYKERVKDALENMINGYQQARVIKGPYVGRVGVISPVISRRGKQKISYYFFDEKTGDRFQVPSTHVSIIYTELPATTLTAQREIEQQKQSAATKNAGVSIDVLLA